MPSVNIVIVIEIISPDEIDMKKRKTITASKGGNLVGKGGTVKSQDHHCLQGEAQRRCWGSRACRQRCPWLRDLNHPPSWFSTFKQGQPQGLLVSKGFPWSRRCSRRLPVAGAGGRSFLFSADESYEILVQPARLIYSCDVRGPLAIGSFSSSDWANHRHFCLWSPQSSV